MSTGRVVAVVQARMGSSRLEGKVLAELAGRPLILFLVERLARARTVDELIVAIPETPDNDDLARTLTEAGVRTFKGAEEDVLDRLYRAAAEADASVVVRITGDCPLVDPILVDSVVNLLVSDPTLDYAAVGPSHPDGLDCEALRFEALEEAWRESTRHRDREHVTTFITRQPERFSVRTIESGVDLGHVRLTIDEREDLEFVRRLLDVGRLGPDCGLDSVLAVLEDLEERPANAGLARNEGLWRSVLAEQLPPSGVGPRSSSERWWRRAQHVIPGSSQTLSKAPDQFVRGVSPTFLVRGEGSRVWDVDGSDYIDYPMALGPVLLGYGHPGPIDAVKRQLRDGTVFTLPHPLEVEVAEMLTELVPSAEMVRFCKNGSDAVAGAVRLARAVTGRDTVAVSGYHGWQDWYIASTARSAGVPDVVGELTKTFNFNDLRSLERLLTDNDVAAVVIEQPAEDPRDGFLEGVRSLTRKHGAVFIWDEIVTGFRFSVGGAQQYYGVTPDLTCLGKAIANGFPLAVLAGSAELMKEMDRIFFSTTFGGETASLAAARATVGRVAQGDVLSHIWQLGEELRAGITRLLEGLRSDIELRGHPPRSGLSFKQEGRESPSLRALFLQETVKRGVLFGGPIFLTFAHSQSDIEFTLDVMAEALDVVEKASESGNVSDYLVGESPEPIFREAPRG